MAGAAPVRATPVLRVGSYQGIPGQFSSIQAAVDAAQPGDWVLIGPGDYHETGNRVAPGLPDTTPGSAVLVTTPNIWIRGMDRNKVVLDGTNPGAPQCSSAPGDQNLGPGNKGRQGINVYEVNGVSVENMTVCNFLSAPNGAGGNEIWFNGGHETGKFAIGSWRGAYLSTTSSYFGGKTGGTATYGLFTSNTYGPGLWTQVYGNNMSDSNLYIGACPNCNSIIDHFHSQNAGLGYSGTNSGGITIQYSEFDHNKDGFDTNTQNNGDQPPPQSGKCPNNTTGPTGTHSCWVFWHNKVHDNNNPNVPALGTGPAAAPVGTGMTVAGGRFDTIVDNDFYNNGGWGVALLPYPSIGKWNATANCHGGVGAKPLDLCYFDDWGNEVANNRFSNNGFFGNPSNGDILEVSGLHFPGNCFHGNVDSSGKAVNAKSLQIALTGVATAPPLLQTFPHTICGLPGVGAPLPSPAALEVLCNTQLVFNCPTTPITNYPRTTGVQLMPLPSQPSMPDPCQGVPRNPWCPTNPVSQPSYPVPGSPVSVS